MLWVWSPLPTAAEQCVLQSEHPLVVLSEGPAVLLIVPGQPAHLGEDAPLVLPAGGGGGRGGDVVLLCVPVLCLSLVT